MAQTRNMGRKTHRIRTAFLILVGLLVLMAGGIMGFALLGKQPTYDLSIASVSAEGLADGTYTGAYSAFRFSNTVAVTVKDQAIRDIQVLKPQLVAEDDIMDALRDEVLAAQSTAVDTVAGATVDSKAYLKAVEIALTNAH